MMKDDGRHCDVPGCKGLGARYGLDKNELVADLCDDDFAIYNREVLKGNMSKPYLICIFCGKKEYMLPAQFTTIVKLMDNRETKRPAGEPRYACKGCSATKAGLMPSVASTSAGKVVFAMKETPTEPMTTEVVA